MISLNNLTFHFGSRVLYDSASLQIKPKDKIGLIGLNGTGKSTLLRIIVGEYQPDGGTISKSNETTIGFLNQDLLSYLTDEDILSVAMQAFERQNEIQHKMDTILKKMETEYSDDLVDKLGKLQIEFEHLDGYAIQAQAEAVLEGLGFATKDLKRPLREFSGGWRMRVMLAKLLLQKPSLLMLDEPTNHLDLPSIEWVESYLTDYEGAVLVVSHDRYFLDNVSETIVEVSNQKFATYAGNYEFYLEEKALRNEIQRGAYENQQQQIKQTERFIERFRYKASKSRQVQSRVKQLARIDLVDEVLDENARIHFRFNFEQQPGRVIAELDQVSKSFGDLEILKECSGKIERGDKIALIGANGRGKSTLLRIIDGGENAGGEVKKGYNVNTAFYAQHQLESLNVENTILEEMKQHGTQKSETELRTILGCFLFSNDDVFKKIKVLSGGEKSRVALAITLISSANFLLLDEPTNHLDIQSVNILIQALAQYEGSFVVVSHDRHFVSRIANKIWWIENNQIKEYLGTYDEYAYWDEQRQEALKLEQQQSGKQEKKPAKVIHHSTGEREEAQKQLKKLQKRLQEVEKGVADLETQKQQTEKILEQTETFANPTTLATQTARYEKIAQDLAQLNAEWENVMLDLEKYESIL